MKKKKMIDEVPHFIIDFDLLAHDYIWQDPEKLLVRYKYVAGLQFYFCD